jgi:signal transduction histidine kinase
VRKGDLTVGESVLADPERIGQVLRNLLSNAAKYSPEGAPIELRIIGKEGHVRLEVADRGPGIHPDDVMRIFEKFGRGRDRGSHRLPGVGLGLYLSRRIVRGHGSELTVEARPGGGSVFGFELAVV